MKRVTALTDHWYLAGFDEELTSPDTTVSAIASAENWYNVCVPSDVHTVLMENNIINDPAIGVNDIKTAWVETQTWVYKTSFELSQQDIQSNLLELHFHGLDTYASVYLNQEKLADCENMFIGHKPSIKEKAKVGENHLYVVFHPLSVHAQKKQLPEGFWINYSTERAYARKAGYMFSWDWTPRVITIGIWRPVDLVVSEQATAIDEFQVFTTKLLDNGNAVLECSVQLHKDTPKNIKKQLILSDNAGVIADLEFTEEKIQFEVENPMLWWTHDLGEPHLYNAKLILLQNGEVKDKKEKKVGIRTIEIQRRLANGNYAFYTKINQVPLFSKGANWVPISNRIPSKQKEDYEYLLGMAKKANMNTIALWGGGIYEQDAFYDYCNENGILIWQYFMFACGEYPDFDKEYLQNIKIEVIEAAKRLASHPSVAVWVGNVEGQMISEKINLDRPMYGKRMFEEYIPEWLSKIDPYRFYISSSPWTEEGLANSMSSGDRHNWDVWFSDIPYTDYKKDTTTFCSEFGLHASPVLATVEKYTNSKHFNDFAFKYFNKDQDLSRMWYYFREHTGEPKSLEEYIDFSMLIQAEALQTGSEHYLRRFPDCGGALIWQLNDCCACHSWSMIDFDGIPKASWYYAKRFFSPVSVSLNAISDTDTEIWLHNGTHNTITSEITVCVGDFFGNTPYEETIEVAVNPGSHKLKTIAAGGRFYPNVILRNRPRLYYIAASLKGEERCTTRFFAVEKNILFPQAKLEVEATEKSIIITTDNFARFVKIDGDIEGLVFSDNYFDLLPQQQRTITATIRYGKPLSERKLFVKGTNTGKYPF